MVQMTAAEKANQIVLLKKQIFDADYTLRSLNGIVAWLPEGNRAHLIGDLSVKNLAFTISCMKLLLNEMES